MFLRKKSAPVSWLVVFLGNPGSRYDGTRHNAGFIVGDAFERSAGIKINRLKFNSLTAQAVVGGHGVFLLKPQTFMNLSGNAVRQAMSFYKVPLSGIITVSDDVSLPAGKLRVRRRGSAGGHNGLKDIIIKCGGEDFPRVKIGVGAPPHADYDMAEWVLSKLSGEDKQLVESAAEQAAEALKTIITQGVDRAMEKYN